MPTFYENIRRLRREQGLSQQELADLTGYTDRSSIAKLEKGLIDLPQSKLETFAKVLGTTVQELSGWTYHILPESISTKSISDLNGSKEDFFGIQITEDSMEPRISKGDFVIARRQDDAESGDIVIVQIPDNDAACRRLQKYADGIMLLSNNIHTAPLVFSNKDLEAHKVKIIGRVMELRARF